MSDDPLISRVVEAEKLLSDLIPLTADLQHLMNAVVLYLLEQPTFNADRFRELYQRERDRPLAPPGLPLDQQLRERLQRDALADYKGEPQ